MVDLVTLAQVRMALRIGEVDDSPMAAHDDDAVLEQLYIPAASKAVIRHLKGQAEVVIPGLAESPPTSDGCPEDVRIAVIDVVRVFYDGSSEETLRRLEQGYLPPVATALLHPLRDPALA